MRPPPSSPLFPYTTLFRSRPDPGDEGEAAPIRKPLVVGGAGRELRQPPRFAARRGDQVDLRLLIPLPLADEGDLFTGRSEEHTSELQSPDHLVCRLLLEKK